MHATTLRKNLFKYALLVGGIPLLLTVALGVFWLIPHARKDIHEHQQQLAAAVSTQVESYLTTSHATVQAAAGLHVNDLDQHNLEHVQHVLEANVGSLQHLRALYLVDQTGRIVSIAIGRGTQRQQQDLIGMDLSRNPLFTNVASNKKEQWSDTFLSVVGGGLSVALAVPSGKQVMIGEFELASLSRFLKRINAIKHQDVFVLDRRGQVIADQDGTYTAQQLNLSNIPLVKQGLQSTTILTGNYQFAGKNMVGSLHRVPGIDWSVLIAQPREQAYAQLLATGGITAAGILAALITGIGIALTLTRSLANRFELLAGHARQVAEGRGASDWPQSNILEFNNLASDLQQMSDTLHERATLLEQEIAERQKAQEELHLQQLQLEALNASLEFRVQEELARNREKDAIMLQQSRLASMGEMMSNIAHQWRQPLNELAILIQTHQLDLNDGNLDAERMNTMVEQSMKTIRHMSKTIDSFRDFHLPQQKPEFFTMGTALRQAIDLVQASLKSGNIKIDLQIDDNCTISGYANEFAQVLLNLINNSRDVLFERNISAPCIKISSRCTGNYTTITVADNAGGIPEDCISKVFDPYFTTKHKSQGTGLGLYMSRMIVATKMGGTLTVVNGAEGAEFTVSVPCSGKPDNGHR